MVIKIYNNIRELFPYFPQKIEYYEDSYNASGSIFGTNWLSESFALGDFGLGKSINIWSIQLKLFKVGVPPSIWACIYNSSLGFPSGLVISSGAFASADITSNTTGSWYDIRVIPNIILRPGITYNIVVRPVLGTGDTSNCIYWMGVSPGVYSGATWQEDGYYSTDGGGSWLAYIPTYKNFNFRIIGTPLKSGIANQITEQKIQRTVVHDIPMANFDVIQSMGTKNRVFAIKGYTYNDSGSAWLRALPGTTGSINYIDERGYNIIPITNVFFSKIDFEDRGGRPQERSFTLDVIEVI
jgi:hypothetical protein